ncbi:MAG: hypothetical protein A3F67_08395 [Verrucomicrobia bacterium RIFCSPHIGHO2_12_FULL_41_10]|nr:MAG: hypothetical protein A3F67_08395 [Verrucomicrobia bacterium RIFCSPHIGHO2_12_FULL_41_10]
MPDETSITSETHPQAITTITAYHDYVRNWMEKEPFLYLLTHTLALLTLYTDENKEEKKILLSHLQCRAQKLSFGEVRQAIIYINRKMPEDFLNNNASHLTGCAKAIIQGLHAHSLQLEILQHMVLTEIGFSLENTTNDLKECLSPIKSAFEAKLIFWKNAHPKNQRANYENRLATISNPATPL